MHILLFDWTAGGHHATYLRRVALALGRVATITVAAPDALLAGIADLPVETIALGAARPPVDLGASLGRQHAALAEAELELLADAIERARPDHALHLYADPLLRWIVRRRRFAAPVSLCIFFARSHYAAAYGNALPPREMARAWFQRLLIERWRRRPDAHALFFLDENAARTFGSGAHWFPEPPVSRLAPSLLPGRREGVALYGALDRRKGIDRIAAAVAERRGLERVTLAGEAVPSYEAELRRQVEAMEQGGTAVDLRARGHGEREGLLVLAGARCALLPYPRHYGMSRVLVEASSVGTPVVVHRFGLLGRLVEEWGLGAAVDTRQPRLFRDAIDRVCDAAVDGAMAERLERFTARYGEAAFARAVMSPFREQYLRAPAGRSVPLAAP